MISIEANLPETCPVCDTKWIYFEKRSHKEIAGRWLIALSFGCGCQFQKEFDEGNEATTDALLVNPCGHAQEIAIEAKRKGIVQ